MAYLIALFGEAEKGRFQHPYLCSSLPQLVEFLGNPPENSQGLYFAVQALLYQRNLLFFRVREEGFSDKDYFEGLNYLHGKAATLRPAAICLPGVGNPAIIEATDPVCRQQKSFLIITEKDLFDYLTAR